MKLPTLPCAALFVLSSLRAQQGVVSPRLFELQEGNSAATVPFGTVTDLYRYQQIHDDVAGTPRVIRRLAFRRDGGPWGPIPAYDVTIDAWISTAATAAAGASATFSRNHGNDMVQVVTQKLIRFRAAPDVIAPPAPFDLVVPFDVDFRYGGTGSICWDVHVLVQTNQAPAFHDFVSNSDPNPSLRFVRFGQGCRASGQNSPLAATVGSTMNWPTGNGTLFLGGRFAPSNAPAILVLGWSYQSWFGIPLPLEVPWSALSPSGPCSLYVNWGLTRAAQADYRGLIAEQGIPLTVFRGTGGVNLFSQTVAFDPNAASGAVTSDAYTSHFVEPFANLTLARVLNRNSSQATGVVTQGVGLVVRFEG